MRFPVRSRCARGLRVEQLEDRTTPSASAVNVVTTTGANRPADATRMAAAPFATGVEYLGFGIYRVDLTAGTTLGTARAYYTGKPRVASVSRDHVIQSQFTPNDPSYGDQYGLAKVSAPAAWNITTGARNFVVAEIDTGVDYTHPDLAANIWTNPGEVPGNGTDDDGNGFVDDVHGWDFANNDNDPMDDNGHGTHVAGTLGAVGNNRVGVVGVDWSVKIMSLKFLDAFGRGVTSDAIKALNYAVAMGVKVSNNSWSVDTPDAALSAAIAQARIAGDIVVVAAGNAGANIDAQKAYPANYSATYNNVVSVAATDEHDQLAYFSNYGPGSVTLAAPGVDILSTLPNGSYGTRSGTSMATPLVTGAIALLWSEHPDWNYIQVIDKLKTSVDPVPELAGKVSTAGRLNVANLFDGPTPPVTGAAGPTVVATAFTGTTSTNLKTIRFTFDAAINPATFTAADIDSFTGPRGRIATSYNIARVPGSGNRQFDVSFAAQTAPGSYTMVIGPDVRDAAGRRMDENGNGLAGEATRDRFTATGILVTPLVRTFTDAGVPQVIPDLGGAGSGIIVPQGFLIDDLNVTVNVNHTFNADLTLVLRGPAGQQVTLFANRGRSGNNLTQTLFDDEAATSIASPTALAPFTGSFRPEQLLAAFDGTNAAGVWTLEVSDGTRGDTGLLLSWSLAITATALS